MVATCLAVVGVPGCLAGKELVADDADVTPLIPPAILPEDSPPTGSTVNSVAGNVVLLTGPGDVVFPVHVLAPPPVSAAQTYMTGLWYMDRLSTCSSSLPHGPCGTRLTADSQLVARPHGGRMTFTQSVNFPALGRCYLIDFYVSPAFPIGSGPEETLPVRPGDVAHESWVVVTPLAASSAYPSFQSCGTGVSL